jgi:hypothetical protein
MYREIDGTSMQIDVAIRVPRGFDDHDVEETPPPA